MLNPVTTEVLSITVPAENLPQTTTESYFTISADDSTIPAIELVAVVGGASTAIEAIANATKLEHSTQGDLCAALDINGDAQFTSYSITGVLTDPMVDTSPALTMERTQLLYAGTIGLTCAASATGTASWTIYYKKRQPSATVTLTA